MDGFINKIESQESFTNQSLTTNINILQEVKSIEENLNNPNYKSFKTKNYWNNQTVPKEENQDITQKEMLKYLLSIEAKLAEIISILKK